VSRRICLALPFGLVTMLWASPRPALSQQRQVPTVTVATARNALAAAEADARAKSLLVSIAVVDPAGDLVAFVRMDGASPASTDISRGKARTAARFKRPTQALQQAAAQGQVGLVTFEGATLVEGGVPITVDGQVVGAVGVSGGTSTQDGQIAQAGAAAAAAAHGN
jgi:glc operon protein GlcG